MITLVPLIFEMNLEMAYDFEESKIRSIMAHSPGNEVSLTGIMTGLFTATLVFCFQTINLKMQYNYIIGQVNAYDVLHSIHSHTKQHVNQM